MVYSTCAPGFAFCLISSLFIDKSEHTVYQIKAEYIYVYGINYIIVCREFQIICIKNVKNFLFFHHFLNVDSSLNNTKIVCHNYRHADGGNCVSDFLFRH